jgi:hypothetical protein
MGFHRAERQLERLRRLVVREAEPETQHDSGPLVYRESRQRLLEP